MSHFILSKSPAALTYLHSTPPIVNDIFIIDEGPMQVKKDTVKTDLLNAALRRFAQQGFQKTSIAQIAKDAGVSTGNFYRYFKTKDALFQEIFSPFLLKQIEDRLRAVTAAITNPKLHAIEVAFMLDESISLRLHLVVLLEKASGSPAQSFRERILNLLVSQAESYAKGLGNRGLGKAEKWLLNSTYSSFLSHAADALLQDDPKSLRSRIQLLRTYHLNGLKPILDGKSL